MIIVLAIITAKQGSETELEKKLTEIIPTVKNEKGAVQYTLHKKLDNPCRFFFYERYTDGDALKLHSESAYLKKMTDEISGMLAEQPLVEVYQVIDGFSKE